jgi:hypothetical protein
LDYGVLKFFLFLFCLSFATSRIMFFLWIMCHLLPLIQNFFLGEWNHSSSLDVVCVF